MSLQVDITRLGDLGVILPTAGFVCVWAWASGSRTAALSFAACCAAALAVTTAIKLPMHALAPPPGVADVLALSSGAPSGHTALATATYGGAAVLLAHGGGRRVRWLGALLALAAVAGVAVTRVTLGAHTVADVVLALAVALPLLLVFHRILRRCCRGWRPNGARLILGVIAVAGLADGLGLSVTSGEFLS